MKENNYNVGLVSLGCSKNQVDAELMLAMVAQGGYNICADASQCDVVIINTCGFIESAKQESIETILEYCDKKNDGKLKCVVVTGCLAERYKEELASEIPETDVVLGIGNNSNIVQSIDKALSGERVLAFGSKYDLSLDGVRVLSNAPYFAYVKLSDGCDNRCTYCAIPLIRGNFRSRELPHIISEVKELVRGGVREINLIAQDTTSYGRDIYGEQKLPQLIDEVCSIEGVHWVRVLYCYPERLTDDIIDAIARQPKVVNYIDVPVQHASGKVLAEMNRRGNKESILALVRKLRERIPNVAIRTTLIAGFPGETEEDFTELCELVTEARFDRLGCFAYSQEEDTPAGEREDQIDPKVRARRAELIMELQMDIAFDIANNMIGKELAVLVEGAENGEYYGRSYMDAPDIDTKVYFTSDNKIAVGDFVNVAITSSREYDLVGIAKF